MKLKAIALIEELEKSVEKMIIEAQTLGESGFTDLAKKPAPEKWSAIECLDHLNRYGEFYIPALKKCITDAKGSWQPDFKPGWLGNKSALSMLPDEAGKIANPMKTFKSKNPALDNASQTALEQFILQQQEFLKILEKCKKINLEKNKCKTTLPLIKFKLGDTLRFVIYHEIRHMEQAKRAIALA